MIDSTPISPKQPVAPDSAQDVCIGINEEYHHGEV